MRKYKDNSIAPIVAIDFDDTISVGASYPNTGDVAPYAREVINFLVDIGVVIAIWTSRSAEVVQDDNSSIRFVDDISPVIEFMNNNGIKYSAINKTVQFAPFLYNTRKIYAHLYVDDRAFGWRAMKRVSRHYIFIYVLCEILEYLIGMPGDDIDELCASVIKGEVTDEQIEKCRKFIKDNWC